MAEEFRIWWHRGTAKGYTDLLPTEWFEKTVRKTEVHYVLGQRGWVGQARFRLAVSHTTATLDYRPFERFNGRNGMINGTYSLHFADTSRTMLLSVDWDGKPLNKRDATFGKYESSKLPSEKIVAQQRGVAKQISRPGQAKFRQMLELAYGGCCCISGCSAQWALQASHISSDAQDDSIDNGLLLRADLHLLFDADQMAIHPRTHIVHFGQEAAESREYKQLHRRAKLAQPTSFYRENAPLATAIKSRWMRFKKQNPSIK